MNNYYHQYYDTISRRYFDSEFRLYRLPICEDEERRSELGKEEASAERLLYYYNVMK